MNCPKCEFYESEVIDSRKSPFQVRRRRVCVKCGFKWTTYEVDSEIYKKAMLKKKVEKQLRSILKSYVKSLSAKEQSEFFDEI